MKKLFYLFFILLFLLACKTQNDITSVMTPESAKDIYLSYLSAKEDALLSSYFSNCQFKYGENNQVGAFTCHVQVDNEKTYIFVISTDKKLKSEVNPTKQDIKELIYIAYLNYNKSLNKITGEKLLFNVNDKMIIDNQEIKQHV